MWQAFNEEIHAAGPGVKTALQLFHAGRYVANGASAGAGDALAPSAVYSSYSHDTPPAHHGGGDPPPGGRLGRRGGPGPAGGL